jgi:hypothetical protein
LDFVGKSLPADLRCARAVWRGIESILSKDWNIKRPSWHGGDILGNECRKLMSSAKLVLEQIMEFSLTGSKKTEDLHEQREKSRSGATSPLKLCFYLTGSSLTLSLLRTLHKDSTLRKIVKVRRHAKKAVEVWRMLELSVTPKCHGSEHHACDQLELPWGLADFCEDWVMEQLHQLLGLKNNRQTKTTRDRDRKCKLHTHWEQLSGNRNVQRTKKEVLGKRKRKLQNDAGGETARALLAAKSLHRETALEEDSSQLTGMNKLPSPEESIRLDETDRSDNNTTDWIRQ